MNLWAQESGVLGEHERAAAGLGRRREALQHLAGAGHLGADGVNASRITGSWAGWMAARPTKPDARPASHEARSPSRSRTSA